MKKRQCSKFSFFPFLLSFLKNVRTDIPCKFFSCLIIYMTTSRFLSYYQFFFQIKKTAFFILNFSFRAKPFSCNRFRITKKNLDILFLPFYLIQNFQRYFIFKNRALKPILEVKTAKFLKKCSFFFSENEVREAKRADYFS